MSTRKRKTGSHPQTWLSGLGWVDRMLRCFGASRAHYAILWTRNGFFVPVAKYQVAKCRVGADVARRLEQQMDAFTNTVQELQWKLVFAIFE